MALNRHHRLALQCHHLEPLAFDTKIVDSLVKRRVIVDFATWQSASNVHCLVAAMTLYVYYDLRNKRVHADHDEPNNSI